MRTIGMVWFIYSTLSVSVVARPPCSPSTSLLSLYCTVIQGWRPLQPLQLLQLLRHINTEIVLWLLLSSLIGIQTLAFATTFFNFASAEEKLQNSALCVSVIDCRSHHKYKPELLAPDHPDHPDPGPDMHGGLAHLDSQPPP